MEVILKQKAIVRLAKENYNHTCQTFIMLMVRPDNRLLSCKALCIPCHVNYPSYSHNNCGHHCQTEYFYFFILGLFNLFILLIWLEFTCPRHGYAPTILWGSIGYKCFQFVSNCIHQQRDCIIDVSPL
jgi:hypothetical protein